MKIWMKLLLGSLIGLALVLGVLTRTSAVFGALMLLTYYLYSPLLVFVRGLI